MASPAHKSESESEKSSDESVFEHLPTELQEQAASAHAALLKLAGTVREEMFPDRRFVNGDKLDISLTWQTTQEPTRLLDDVVDAVRRQVEAQDALRPRAVYCYQCANATCEHCQPNGPGEVFAGYDNGGRPTWQELFNFLTALDDNRVDMLFEERAHLIGKVVSRKRLITDQMVAFGRNSMTYRIVGQVVAGYIVLAGVKYALSIQLIETASRDLHVQALMHPRLEEALADANRTQRTARARISEAISKFRRSIKAIMPEWKAARTRPERVALQAKLFSELRHLLNSIEQKGRQSRRRTQHAELRGNQQRPVHKAADDVSAAPTENFFQDTVRQSIIVVGRSGRCHVFTEKGKHITSMILPADKLEKRQRTRRYIMLEASHVASFRPSVLNACNDQTG